MNTIYKIPAFVILMILFAFQSSFAQQWNELPKVIPSDGFDFDEFGDAVAINEDYAIIGAHWNDDMANDAGAVYIYKKEGGAWIQQTKLFAEDASMQSQFGNSVSISGDYIVIGAYTSSDLALYSGSAYVFKREGEIWTQEAKLLPSSGLPYDYFGQSVSISGDYIVIGVPFDDNSGEDRGSLYIYKHQANNWILDTQLLANDGVAGDEFGFTVDISGNYIVAGAPLDEVSIGSAYIFRLENETWVQQTKLIATDASENIYFGNSVAISGDYAIVGTFQGNGNADHSGAAYIFEREDGNWLQQEKLTASDGAFGDYFGYHVSISANQAIIGAKNDEDQGFHAGSAYIFKKENTGWVEQEKVLPNEVSSSDAFGSTVAISNNNIIIGARGDDDNGMNSGAVYMYEFYSSSVIGIVSDATTNIPLEDAIITLGTSYSAISNALGFYNIENMEEGNYTLICELAGYETYSTEVEVETNETINIEMEFLTNTGHSLPTQNNISITNYPNPFNSETTISYSIPFSNNVNIAIYNIQGKRIKTLINSYQKQGNYTIGWNGTDELGLTSECGLYFCKIITGNYTSVKEIIIIE
ncbi:MAG: T9SS type A sorting domain-containing protein [Bacteroidales bacterium]|nr:T9SS type A sorting domain-containing protein [Bacteroidales bacterium]